MELFARHSLGLLLDMSLRSLLLLAVAGVALLCLRHSSASARHFVLLLTLVCLLLLPLLSAVLPRWQVRIWPRTPTALLPVGILTPSQPTAIMPPQKSPVPVLPTSPSDPEGKLLVGAEAPFSNPALSRPRHDFWTLAGFGLWVIGVVAVLMPVLAGLVRIRRIGRRSLPITTETITNLAAELVHELGLRRTVCLRQSAGDDTLGMPMTWGWRHPIVLLPVGADAWPEERLRVVLLHEMAHVQRGDWLWQTLAHVTCVLYWFHPGVWLVAGSLRAESERACDDRVLSAGVPALDYARHLLEVVCTLSATKRASVAALPMADTSQIEQRLRAIICSHRRRNKMAKRMTVLTGAAAIAVLLPLAMLRPVTGAQQAAPAPEPAPTLRGMIVVVDPGHGGQDTGAVGADGTREKDISLAVAQKLRETLTKHGARVIMTRSDDTFLPLMARPAFVKANKAQYLVSIHCDSRGDAKSQTGTEIYYHGEDTQGRRMASCVASSMAHIPAIPTNGILSDKTRFSPGGFGVLRGSPVPSVLVECGFMNNAHDLMALRQQKTQQQIADGIEAGLEQFDRQYIPIKEKLDFITFVHAHDKHIVRFWDEVSQISDVYMLAVKRNQPALFANRLADSYSYNGNSLTKQQAERQLQDHINKYGSRSYKTQFIKVEPGADLKSILLLSTEQWESDNNGIGVERLSRRDSWTKTPVGWRLAATEEKGKQ